MAINIFQVSLDALKFLIEERGVKSIGHETFDTDASIDTAKNGDIVGERYILGQDTFQVELLTNLDQLPTRGAIIYAISPKPKDAPGFPVRAFAIKPIDVFHLAFSTTWWFKWCTTAMILFHQCSSS